MPWAAVAGGVASAVAGSALSGGGGGGGGGGTTGGSAPPVYIPTNQAGMDANFNQNINQYQNQINQTQGQVSPYNQQLLNSQFNNPAYQTAAINSGWAQNVYDLNSQQQQGASMSDYNYANQQNANT